MDMENSLLFPSTANLLASGSVAGEGEFEYLEFAKLKHKPQVPKDSLLRAPGESSGNPIVDARIMAQVRAWECEQQQFQKLTKLTERTGMPLTQENGQRRYGPPLDPEVPVPVRGSEIFVGKIPRDSFEPELVPIFERAGRIYEMRLMMDFSGSNRGYCFVQYYTPAEALRATKELNGFEIRPRRRIGVVISVDNSRLFFGNVPTDKGPEEIREEIERLADGVVKVVCPPVPPELQEQQRNRGFFFIEFESHKSAAMARRKFVPGKLQLWDTDVAVDWADPVPEVQTLFVKNLSPSTTEETLRDVFNRASENGVEKVKKIRDFAFVQFSSPSLAEMAKAALDNATIDGSEIKVHYEGNGKHDKSRGNKVRIQFDWNRNAPSFKPKSFDGNEHTGRRDVFKQQPWKNFGINNHAKTNFSRSSNGSGAFHGWNHHGFGYKNQANQLYPHSPPFMDLNPYQGQYFIPSIQQQDRDDEHGASGYGSYLPHEAAYQRFGAYDNYKSGWPSSNNWPSNPMK